MRLQPCEACDREVCSTTLYSVKIGWDYVQKKDIVGQVCRDCHEKDVARVTRAAVHEQIPKGNYRQRK
jgi:hypothetical protein